MDCLCFDCLNDEKNILKESVSFVYSFCEKNYMQAENIVNHIQTPNSCGVSLVLFNIQSEQIKVVKILQELAESEPKADPKHQRKRWTNIS